MENVITTFSALQSLTTAVVVLGFSSFTVCLYTERKLDAHAPPFFWWRNSVTYRTGIYTPMFLQLDAFVQRVHHYGEIPAMLRKIVFVHVDRALSCGGFCLSFYELASLASISLQPAQSFFPPQQTRATTLVP